MEVKTVGVYGAGLMGRGIAQVALEGGYDVVLYNHRTPTLEKGVAGIKKGFEKKVAKGKITQEQADGWLGHLKATIELEDLKDVDIVFEAMVENMALKKEAFAKMAPIIKPEAIFVSNTSSLSITELAAASQRPEKFLGMHFFSPVPAMKLVEIINAYIAANYASYTKPIFLAGDFNESNMSSEMMVKLKEKWEIISTSSNTFMNTATPKRIDYIVLYKGNKAACEVLGTAVPSYDEINVNKVSDHLPVLVDIKK